MRHSGALFPLPLPATAPPGRVAAVCARFRFLGRLMAAACRDGFIVPLPLSMHFLHLARGGSLSYAALPPPTESLPMESRQLHASAHYGALSFPHRYAALPPPTEAGGRLSAYAAVVSRLAQYDAACAAGQISEMERLSRYELEAEAEFGQSKLGMSMPLSLRGALDLEAFVCPLTQVCVPLSAHAAPMSLVNGLLMSLADESRQWPAVGCVCIRCVPVLTHASDVCLCSRRRP